MNFQKEDLQRALSNDPETLDRFVNEALPVIQSRVMKVLVCRRGYAFGRDIRQEVDDLVQEVFLYIFNDQGKVLLSWESDKGLSLKNFIGLVAERKARAILTIDKRSPWAERPIESEQYNAYSASTSIGSPTAGSASEARDFGPEELTASTELLRVLFDRLEQELSPLGMRLFRLLYVENNSLAEVCATMQMTKDAVYAWRSRLLRQARELLKDLLSESDGSTQDHIRCV